MYTREEAKELKRDFWNGFDEFCSHLPRFKYKNRKWILYNTKIKNVEMKFEVGRKGAKVILELNHRDETRRREKYDVLLKYRKIIEEKFDNPVYEELFYKECGTPVSRIYKEIEGIDIHRREDWQTFYVFLSKEMTKLEKVFGEIREMLQEKEEE